MPRDMTDERMHDEVSEVSDRVCDEWEIDFLEDIEARARDNDLSEPQHDVLRRLWERACASPY